MKNVFFTILLYFLIIIDAHPSDHTSVMASGSWYKMFIYEDGIYRITYSELQEMGIGNPADVRIYGSGGAMLPELPEPGFDHDLKEIPVFMDMGNDGVFNDGDYILFYGQGPVVWRYNNAYFEHSLHLYDSKSCYFVTSKPGGRKIIPEASPQQPATKEINSFDEHLFHEAELTNVLKSGRYWYGEYFRNPLTYSFSFDIPDIDPGSASVDVAFLARAATTTMLEIDYNGQRIASSVLPVISGQQYAVESSSRAAFSPVSENITIKLTLNQNGNGASEGWLNYIRLQARRKLNLSQSYLFFRDTQSVGAGEVGRFVINNGSSETQVWDITDMHEVKRMPVTIEGSNCVFNAGTGHLREFVAFRSGSGWLKPDFQGTLENQNLNGIDRVDMIIVSHPDFMEAATQLADLHKTRDGMDIAVVTTRQVYHEFSSGMQDPVAIRNLMKWVYEKPSSKLRYLLLMGDGSFDNKSNKAVNNNTDFVVTYQSVNSAHNTDSFVSDDFFGILGDGDAILNGSLKIGLGRLPVQTPEQALEMVNKIRRYMDMSQQNDWPNLIGMLADDGDLNEHMLQSDKLARYVNDYHSQYTVNKLYFDAYPQVSTVDGHRYPAVEQELGDLMNKGCLLINYMGHGNETGLSDERVVTKTSISQWVNKILPLFVVATCEFGRYDDYTRDTAGEDVVLNPDGGAIALFTSTRLVYSYQNYELNDRFFRALFMRPAQENAHRLGDIMRLAKNSSTASVNRLAFTLLGDPALKPPVPFNLINTLSINGTPVDEPLDTLKANSIITVSGEITDISHQRLTGFNGVVHISLYDKAREKKTLDNEGESSPMSYTTQTSLLYKGKASVVNGLFETTFVVPRDINYQYGTGKFTYYAFAENTTASGAFDQVVVGGAGPSLDDNEGPGIRLFMNDTLFRDGGLTDQNPLLVAYLSDENGINTGGEGIGHDITAVLSNDPSQVYILNSYYEAALDDHRKGTVTYRFSNLPDGDYDLTFTAWDVANNFSRASIRFHVTSSVYLQIDKLYNYPNPFTDFTNIYFEYNQPDKVIEAQLQIFDMSGRLRLDTRQSIFTEGYTSGSFRWAGRDGNGNRMNSGIYLFRVTLRNQNGQKVWKTAKLVII